MYIWVSTLAKTSDHILTNADMVVRIAQLGPPQITIDANDDEGASHHDCPLQDQRLDPIQVHCEPHTH